jgi:transposase-like protein
MGARWRKYTCNQCRNAYEVFTVSPLPEDKRTCYLCQKQHLTLRSYANSLGAAISVRDK